MGKGIIKVNVMTYEEKIGKYIMHTNWIYNGRVGYMVHIMDVHGRNLICNWGRTREDACRIAYRRLKEELWMEVEKGKSG